MENIKDRLKLSKKDAYTIDEITIGGDAGRFKNTLWFVFRDGNANDITFYPFNSRSMTLRYEETFVVSHYCSKARYELMKRCYKRAMKEKLITF